MRRKTKRNLAIAVVIALIGVILLYAGMKMYSFRLDGGYSNVVNQLKDSPLAIVTGATFIMIAEWVLTIVGIAMTFIGGLSIYCNSKKLRR